MNKKEFALLIVTLCITLGYAALSSVDSKLNLFLTIFFLVVLVLVFVQSARERKHSGAQSRSWQEKIAIMSWVLCIPRVVDLWTANAFIKFPVIAVATVAFVLFMEWSTRRLKAKEENTDADER